MLKYIFLSLIILSCYAYFAFGILTSLAQTPPPPPTTPTLDDRVATLEAQMLTMQGQCTKVTARLDQLDKGYNALNSQMQTANLQLSTVSVLTALGLDNQKQLTAVTTRVSALDGK